MCSSDLYHQDKVNCNVIGFVEFCGIFVFYDREEYNHFDNNLYLYNLNLVKLDSKEMDKVNLDITHVLKERELKII